MMTEQDMKEKIKNSAKQIEIPEGLRPEPMKEKFAEAWRIRKKQRMKYTKIGGAAAAAACLMIVYASGVFFSAGGRSGAAYDAVSKEGAQAYDMASNEDGASDALREESVLAEHAGRETSPADKPTGSAEDEKKRDAGDLYAVAKDYGEVYDALYENQRIYGSASRFEAIADRKESSMSAGIEKEAAEEESGATADRIFYEDGSADAAFGGTSAADTTVIGNMAADISASLKKEYSKTNLQTAGVDESDIIKTDGSYIYTVTDNEIWITDVRTDTMKHTGRITIPMNSAADSVWEMYVDGDTLNLILEKESTQLNQSTQGTDTESAETAGEDTVYDDVYYLDSAMVTELLTYDISDRANPVLKGSITQEGGYQTSRKIGNIVYLFTNEGMARPVMERSAAVLEDHASGWIPLVNGKAVAADCIYVPQEDSRQGLIISSVNVKEPDQVIDTTLIVNNYVTVYVGSSSIYLYNLSYLSDTPNTQIAKFSMNNGKINAVGAASVRGEITDTFAINESAGKLRVLTTDWSGADDENQLYLLDADMNLTGKLEHIAAGEQIYAARFFGNTAYFVTYRNTDPLFAVDLSDEASPKILSELKITGFSEYLHFWGNDKLLGIGYETDENTGEQLGIKLTMFDISNPADLQTAGTCVVENADYSPALYDYKCVLVDEKENLIGFPTETYKNNTSSYLLFSWEDGKFADRMTETLDRKNGIQLGVYRGIYIGDTFYIANPTEICSYDRKNDYQLLQKLALAE